MKALIGLGNPGEKYENTRHNVGFMLLDKLAKINNLEFKINKKLKSSIAKKNDLLLVKPQTFMNSSGVAVQLVAQSYKLTASEIYVIHDDLDLGLGTYKVQQARGPKVHNGVNSIEENLKKDNFYRVRIGVDNRDPDNRIKGEDYVLQVFSEDELKVIDQVIQKIYDGSYW